MSKTLTLGCRCSHADIEMNAYIGKDREDDTKTQSSRHRKSQRVNMSCVWRQAYARYNSAGSLQVTDITQAHTLIHTYVHNGWSVGHFEIKAFVTSDCPFIRKNRKWPWYQRSCQTVFATKTWIHQFLWIFDVCVWEDGKSEQCELARYNREIVGGFTQSHISVFALSVGHEM